MAKHLYIRLKDGERETELTIDEPSKPNELAIIDGIFRFFDIDLAFMEMAEAYVKTGHLYRDFYNEQNNSNFIESAKPKAPEVSLRTGTKWKDGKIVYKCRYKCPTCRNNGTHYIQKGISKINCHRCSQEMKTIRSVDGEKFKHDSTLAYYVAGLSEKEPAPT